MAFHYLVSFSPSQCLPKPQLPSLSRSRTTHVCMSSMVTSPNNTTTIVRRSANYKPPVWDYNNIQSLQSRYVGESYEKRAAKLKEEVRMMIDGMVADGPSQQLELIDVLQRLGLSYHFEHEIDNMLESIYNNVDLFWEENGNDLYVTALAFRLFRQHHFNVPQDVFTSFMDQSGINSKAIHDLKGVLSLYEASYLSVEGEDILKKARELATKHLQDYVMNNGYEDHEDLSFQLVRHSLELPLHWRATRVESRWFIEFFEKQHDHNNDVLLELAKLDFNMVQAIHQDDLKKASRWWNKLGFGEKLRFSRDMVMENFLWQSGNAYEPQFGYYRRKTTQLFALINAVDDAYDIYGTLDELELFTDAVERWDIKAIDHLPHYMKICFMGLYNSVNEIAFDILKQLGVEAISYLRQGWTSICKAYLKEARWYYSGYIPTLEEYLDNAWLSIALPGVLMHTYFFVDNSLTQEALQCLKRHDHDLIRCSSIITRLGDDLGTSTDEIARGENINAIKCYMHETGASEEVARKHIWQLISKTWDKLNKVKASNSPFSKDFIKMAKNTGRMSKSMYEEGDGRPSDDHKTMSFILSLLVQPIPL